MSLSLARGSIVTFSAQVIQLGASFIVGVIVARSLGPEGKGLYSYITVIGALLVQAGGLGLSASNTYLLGKKEYAAEHLASNSVAFCLISGILVDLALTFTYSLRSETLFRGVTAMQVVALCVLVPSSMLLIQANGILWGLGKVERVNIIGLAQTVVMMLAVTVLMIVGSISVTTTLWALTILTFVAAATAVVSTGAARSLRFTLNFDALRASLSYGIRTYVANLTTFFNYRLDALILNTLLNSASLGLYTIAVSLAEFVWYISNSVSAVAFPHVASLSRSESDHLAPILIRNVILLSAVSAIGLGILSPFMIVTIFGDQFLPALEPMWLLLPGVVALAGGKVIASYLSGIGKPIYCSYISGASLILTIILDLLLIPIYNIKGAAIASTLVYCSTTGLALFYYLKESGSGWRDNLIVGRQDLKHYAALIHRIKAMQMPR